MNQKVRIAVLNSHPIQYFAPLYSFLAATPDLDVTALYCSDVSLRGGKDPGFGRNIAWDIDLLGGYRSVFLGDRASLRVPGGFLSLVCPEVWGEVRSGKYDVLWLHGYSYAADVVAFVAAKSRGIPVLMRSETHLGLPRSPWKQRLRDFVLSIGYRFVDGFLAIGSRNRKYYESLGVPSENIHLVPYTVDNNRFIQRSSIDETTRRKIREKYQVLSGDVVVLYASKLTPRKRAADLIRAVELVTRRGLSVHLLLVGTGELECELRALVEKLELGNVTFGGFVNQAEMPHVFAASDIFSLPSEGEPWGLIVNEAMCAALPAIVSSEVGCVPDLVEHGLNGFVTKVGDIESIADAIGRLASDRQLRSEMGHASRERIRGWSYEQCVVGLRAAIRQLRGHIAA